MDLNENAERALRMVRENKIGVSYDTEGTGLDWKVNNPTGFVIGAPKEDGSITQDDVVYVPIRHGGGGNLAGGVAMQTPTDSVQPHPWEVQLAKAFADRTRMGASFGRVVGHHMKFDVHFSANVGVMLGRNLACTQNQEAMLDEYARSYSLDSCAKRHGVTEKLGNELYEHLARQFGGPAERGSMQHYWKLAGNDPIGVDYACGDAVSTWELYQSQVKALAADDMNFVVNLENDLIWTIFRMERRGIKVDLNRVDQLRHSVEADIKNKLKSFPLGFNVRSPLMIKKAFEDAGILDWPKTEKGAPSFTEKFLAKSELGRGIIQIRQMSNLINSFVEPLATRHTHTDGRVHATLNQLKSDDKGTISGRFSCNDPNLQQVPKRNKSVAKPFRRLFVADEGKIFWERDYSQCEPRLFAHYSQDENLLRGYNSQPFVDVHTTVATLLDVERDPTAKRMNMGIFTGMQTRAFADHMGWDVTRASQAWNDWYKAFPGVRAFQDKAKARLLNRGFVFSLLGRRQRLEDRRFAYRGTSKIIQSSNADIVKLKLLEADRTCEDNGDIVQVLMTVHDSFNGQRENTPEAKKLLDEIVHAMEQVQCEPYNLSVPFVMEGEEGGDWCEATWGPDK